MRPLATDELWMRIEPLLPRERLDVLATLPHMDPTRCVEAIARRTSMTVSYSTPCSTRRRIVRQARPIPLGHRARLRLDECAAAPAHPIRSPGRPLPGIPPSRLCDHLPQLPDSVMKRSLSGSTEGVGVQWEWESSVSRVGVRSLSLSHHSRPLTLPLKLSATFSYSSLRLVLTSHF
jgi:hypothetical protein